MDKEFSYKKRILFVGMPDTAFVTLAWLKKIGANIVGVVPPAKNHPSHKIFVDFAKGLGFAVINYENSLNEPEFLSALRGLKADIAIVTSYCRLFPLEFLSVAKDGFLNAHPSLLPEYRGANPYSHVIMNGETRTGVTLHFMDETFDTGDIVMQRVIEVSHDETMGTLFNKLNFVTAEMLEEFLAYYELHEDVPRLKQPEGARFTSPKILPDSPEVRIDWSRSAQEIARFIRALNPFLIATTMFKGSFVKIFTADWAPANRKEPDGTVVAAGSTIDVAAGSGVVKIRTLQLSNYIICDSRDFCSRFAVKKGDKFD